MTGSFPGGFDAARSGFRSAPKNLLLLLLRGYKRFLSPILLPSCRYVPTCSDYAAEAIDKFGAARGTALAIWRLLRCHPFVRGGFDPVMSGRQVFPWTKPSGAASSEPEPSVACSHISH